MPLAAPVAVVTPYEDSALSSASGFGPAFAVADGESPVQGVGDRAAVDAFGFGEDDSQYDSEGSDMSAAVAPSHGDAVHDLVESAAADAGEEL